MCECVFKNSEIHFNFIAIKYPYLHFFFKVYYFLKNIIYIYANIYIFLCERFYHLRNWKGVNCGLCSGTAPARMNLMFWAVSHCKGVDTVLSNHRF